MILLYWSLFGCSILPKRYHKHRDVPHIGLTSEHNRPYDPYDIYKHKFLETGSKYRAFSHDVTAAKLVFQNKETGAMLVYQDNPVGIELELFSYVKPFFCLNKLAYIAVCAGHVREYPLLSLVRTPQERRQFYLSPLEKRFYSTLYSPNMNDVTFPLISPEIYSRYFHHSEFDILDNKSSSEKPLS